LTPKEKLREPSRAVTILFTNRNIFLSCLIRIINTLSLFGFAVIMPMLFVGRLGFTMSEWLQIWAVFFFVTIFTNIMWGIFRGENWLVTPGSLVWLCWLCHLQPGVLLSTGSFRP
jgi:hypothetical protein